MLRQRLLLCCRLTSLREFSAPNHTGGAHTAASPQQQQQASSGGGELAHAEEGIVTYSGPLSTALHRLKVWSGAFFVLTAA